MAWGEIEVTDEVRGWILSLPEREYARTLAYIDLLAERGLHLGEPHTRQLKAKLRELRFPFGWRAAADHVLHRVGQADHPPHRLPETRQREAAEVRRAETAMARHQQSDKESR